MAYSGNGIWCVGEFRKGSILPSVYELITAAKEIAAKRGDKVSLVLAGKGASAKAAEAASRGADEVLVLEHDALEHQVDEAHAGALAAAARARSPRTILFSASLYGKAVAPRLAVELNGALASDASSVSLDSESRLCVKRSSYSGNIIATVVLKPASGPEIATVSLMAFERSPASSSAATVAALPVDSAAVASKTQFVSFSADSSGEIDLGAAEKIVAGGRGLGGAEGFELIRSLAKSLGAAVGASRAVVDSGWIPYKHQVGLTGRQVRPRLYVACGISGQIQHLAGMKSSDVIVALNTDADCPMMKLATYAVKGDLKALIPAIVAEIARARGNGAA